MKNPTRRRVIAAAVVAVALTALRCHSNEAADAPRAAATPSAVAQSPTGMVVPEKLRAIIANTLKVSESRVTPDASFTEDLGADDLGMVELVMAYDRAFEIRIPDADAERFRRVRDVVEYLRRRNVID